MATSIQTIGNKTEMFNDMDLLLLLNLMIEETEHNLSYYSILSTYAGVWRKGLNEYGPGVIDLSLDSIIKNSKGKEQFEKLLLVVEHNIEQFGETIPSNALNSRLSISGVSFHDYQTRFLISAIEKIRRLIA